MKKVFTVLMAVLLVAGLVISCNSDLHETEFNDEKIEIFSVDYEATTDGMIKATVNASEKANDYWYRVGSDDVAWIPMEEEHSQTFTEEEIIAGLHFKVTYTRKAITDETVLSAIHDANGWLIRSTETDTKKDREYLLKSKSYDYYYCHFEDAKCTDSRKGTLSAESFKTTDEETEIKFAKDENGTQKFASVDELVKASNEKKAYVQQKDSSYKPVERNIGSSDIQSCTVSFKGQEKGIENWPIDQQVKIGDKAIKPSDPEKAGWVFVDWYTTPDYTTVWDFSNPVTTNTDLYSLFVPLGDALIFTATEGSVTLGMTASGTAPEIELEYVASGNWKDFVVGTTSITLTAGTKNDKAFFRAKTTNTSLASSNSYNYFTTTGTGKLSLSGDVMWLLDKETTATDMDSYAFKHLFNNCSCIADASALALSAETLTANCYEGMFEGCSNMKKAPVLPATTLTDNCYYAMFSGCTSLEGLTVSFTDWNMSAYSTYDWLAGSAGISGAKFTCPKELVTPKTRGGGTIPTNWEIDKEMYTVRYMMNDGTQDVFTSQTNVDWNATVATPTDVPKRDGYGFDAWYKEASCTNKWDFSTDKVTTNTDLYAKWSQNQGFGYEIVSDTDLTCTITKVKTQGQKEWTLTATSGTDLTYSWYVNAAVQSSVTNTFVFAPKGSGSYLIECVITKGAQRGSDAVRINSWD